MQTPAVHVYDLDLKKASKHKEMFEEQVINTGRPTRVVVKTLLDYQ